MILGFADETTKALADRKPVRKIPADLAKQAAKRLAYLAAATRLEDLYQPPSNHFHALAGSGRFAIRVNMQWRITFRWTDNGPADVLFEDYH